MMKYSVFLRDFNPRSREGSDLKGRTLELMARKFQSTLPRGERLRDSRKIFPAEDFNPRSREGSDFNFI